MIRRPLLVAAAFAVSALVLFGALARITAMTLALERSEAAALQRATQEENVRIALWQLDATLTGLIALENTRPAARFRSASEPAGLLPGLVHARFEVGADRRLRAEPALARAATGWRRCRSPSRRRAGPRSPRRRFRSSPQLRRRRPPPAQLAPVPAAARPIAQDLANVLAGRFPSAPGVLADPINCNENGQQLQYTQEALNTLAFQRRQELGRQATLVRPASAPPGVEVESAFEARWLDGDLVLLRRVRRGDERLLQGTWLDWPALRAFLLAQVAAVAPASGLEPVGERDGADPGRRLALLPARLVPGPMLETEPQDWTPVRLSLAAAWGAALLGLVGVGSLLKGAVTLSQRRADFVSAVTHELRTPLTTFRLYTEMLRRGHGARRASGRPISPRSSARPTASGIWWRTC